MTIHFQPPAMCRVANQQPKSHIQPGLECLQGWGIHSLLGQPVPVCHHPLSEKLPPKTQPKPPSFKPFPLVLSLPTLVNSHSPSCLYAPFKYWKATRSSPQSLLFSTLKKLSSLTLFHRRGSSSDPPLDSIQELHVFLVFGAPGQNSVLQMGPHKS